MIEAAVVHHEATGKDTLLSIARRYADLLCERFGKGPGKMNGYCGHPEIELALMRLYRLTGDVRYLELSRFFIDERGASPNYFEREAIERLDRREFRPNHPGSPYAYMQAHEPIRQQTKVVGHAVRAMYLLSAVVDVGVATKDASLLETAERLWRDVIDTKLYLTGGIGPRPKMRVLRAISIFQTKKPMPKRALRLDYSCSAIGWYSPGWIRSSQMSWSWRFTIVSFPGSAWMVNPSFMTIH